MEIGIHVMDKTMVQENANRAYFQCIASNLVERRRRGAARLCRREDSAEVFSIIVGIRSTSVSNSCVVTIESENTLGGCSRAGDIGGPLLARSRCADTGTCGSSSYREEELLPRAGYRCVNENVLMLGIENRCSRGSEYVDCALLTCARIRRIRRPLRANNTSEQRIADLVFVRRGIVQRQSTYHIGT